jgi:putative PIN family toxin of toxin-antitoxin system
VVLDTNIFVRNFKSRSKTTPNRRIVRLWLLDRKIQLIVSEEIVVEYLEIYDEVLAMERDLVSAWRERFTDDPRTTFVNIARREGASRDPDDNVFLSTAQAGRAKYLVTNDRDLLDIPQPARRGWRFSILNPAQFLAALEEGE